MPMRLIMFGVKPILSAAFAWDFIADCILALSFVSIGFRLFSVLAILI